MSYVLVVEDDESVREAVLDILREEGIPAIGTRDGLAALEHLRSASCLPGVILTDLMMPGLDGWSLTEAVRADALLRDIRIVMMTASPFFAAPPGVPVLRKPFHCTTLLQALGAP